MDARRLVQCCFVFAADCKGMDGVILDVRGLSSVTDYFLVVSGGGGRHLEAIVEGVRLGLGRLGVRPFSVDGRAEGGWVVLDFFVVLVHVMSVGMRERYGLEVLWGDAPRVRPRRPRGLVVGGRS